MVCHFIRRKSGKIEKAAHDSIEVAKVLVKDEAEKDRLLAAGHDYHFVTNIDDILADEDIAIVVELMGRIEPAKHLLHMPWKQASIL